MKKLSCCLLFLVAILLSVKSNAQVSSRNGDYYPVKDTMRILYVFSEVPDDTVTFNHPNWPPGEMPIDPEGYLDAELDTSNMFGFLTKYFYQASFGEFIILGDYIDTLVPLSLTDANYSNFTDIINYLNDSLGGTDLETARGYSINSNVLDEWKSFPQGLEKTKQSNDRIDLIIILYRQKSPMSLKNGGYVLGSDYSIDLKQKVGIDGRSEFVDHGANAYGLMRHEFAHTLIGGNNWHTQGGRGPRKVLPIPGGYGILSSFGRISESWNAYDRYRLGWKPDTHQYFISARRADNNNEVNSAFEYGQAFQGNVDTFILRDFVTYGDAIQIQLPYLKADNSSVQHQYLWIENRQSMEGNIDMGPKGKPGIYAYLQIGKDDTSNFIGEQNNYIYFLNAFGNYDMDYDVTGDRLLIDTDKANPLTGVHMAMEPVWDLDGNGQIYGNEWLGDPSLNVNGQNIPNDSFNYLNRVTHLSNMIYG